MPAGAESVLRAVQPYATGDDTLIVIHELDIIDKHRLLITAVAILESWGVDTPQDTIWFDKDRIIPLVPGYEISNIPTSTYSRQDPHDFRLEIDVTFGKPETVQGVRILDGLHKMASTVNGIITQLEQLLI